MNKYNLIIIVILFAGCKKEADLKDVVKADFTYSGQLQNFTPIQFKDLSSGASSYNWNFGDGTSSNEQNPIHIFRKAGNYSVELTSSAQGISNKKSQQLVLSQADTLSLILDSVSGKYRFTKKSVTQITYAAFGNAYASTTNVSSENLSMLVRRDNGVLRIDNYAPMPLLRATPSYREYNRFWVLTGVNAANYNSALFKKGTDSLKFVISSGGAGGSYSTTYIGEKEK